MKGGRRGYGKVKTETKRGYNEEREKSGGG